MLSVRAPNHLDTHVLLAWRLWTCAAKSPSLDSLKARPLQAAYDILNLAQSPVSRSFLACMPPLPETLA
jgi:hypothetical protein